MSPLLLMQGFLQVLLLLVCSSEAYKPVVIVHGLFDGPKEFKTLTKFIQQAHPGTEVSALGLYDDAKSLWPLWTQTSGFKSALESKLNQSREGAHLLCFSQGGVICRALLSVIPNHNIHSFIALSSPLAGQYGVTEYVKKVFPKIPKKLVHKVCYHHWGQEVSICQYWNVFPMRTVQRLPHAGYQPYNPSAYTHHPRGGDQEEQEEEEEEEEDPYFRGYPNHARSEDVEVRSPGVRRFQRSVRTRRSSSSSDLEVMGDREEEQRFRRKTPV